MGFIDDMLTKPFRDEIERLKLENMNLRAQRDKMIQDCAMLELELIKQKRKPPEPPPPPAGPDTRKFRTAADLLPPKPPEPKYTY